MDRVDFVEFYSFRWMEPDELLVLLWVRCRQTKVFVKHIDFPKNEITFSAMYTGGPREITFEVVFSDDHKMGAFTNRQLLKSDNELLQIIGAEKVYRTLMEELSGEPNIDVDEEDLKPTGKVLSAEEVDDLLKGLTDEVVDEDTTDEYSAERQLHPDYFIFFDELKENLVGKRTASGKMVTKVDMGAIGNDWHYGIFLDGEYCHYCILPEMSLNAKGLCEEFLQNA